MARWSADPRTFAVSTALAGHAWRTLTEQMLARLVVGAADRHRVIRLIQSVPGAAVGELGPLEPAGTGDPRVDVLVRTLGGRQWRALARDRLCADLLAALDGWQARQDSLPSGPGGLPDGR